VDDLDTGVLFLKHRDELIHRLDARLEVVLPVLDLDNFTRRGFGAGFSSRGFGVGFGGCSFAGRGRLCRRDRGRRTRRQQQRQQ
jgi:hypothetical protein